jgi:glycosyltransferase involved in cell wall biosynthesis
MKVAVILADVGTSAGGLYYSVRALSAGIAVNSEVDVKVFASGCASEAVMKHWCPLVPETFPVRGPRSYSYAPGLLEALIAFKPDVIHLHGIWQYTSHVARKAAVACGSQLVLSPRGMMDAWAMRNSKWKKKLMFILQEKQVLNRVDCFHALNQSEADSIRGLGHTQHIKIIPNGTDLPDRNDIGLLGGENEDKKIVFIGRIHPKKGIAELLNAWKLLRDRSPNLSSDWKLVIAGWDDGGHLEGYQKKAIQLGLADSIEWPGKVYGHDKERLLHETSAFILPSFSEGLPMAVVEAMAYGLPVIMTEACNIPEAFAAGAALRIEPNPESICEGLAQFIGMPSSEASGIGEKARNLVESKFTWEQQVNRMQGVYQNLLDDSG